MICLSRRQRDNDDADEADHRAGSCSIRREGKQVVVPVAIGVCTYVGWLRVYDAYLGDAPIVAVHVSDPALVADPFDHFLSRRFAVVPASGFFHFIEAMCWCCLPPERWMLVMLIMLSPILCGGPHSSQSVVAVCTA